MGIIVARDELPIIELAPLGVNYDQTVEEMIAEYGPKNNPDITSGHFPKPPMDKTGVVEESLCLVRPVPTGQYISDENVEKTVTEAGYAFEEWSSLGPLKEHADELWSAGIQYIVARGPNSRWRDPVGTHIVYFGLRPEDRRFYLDRLGRVWSGRYWFLCRKSSQPSDT